jgi:hypothetical protein
MVSVYHRERKTVDRWTVEWAQALPGNTAKRPRVRHLRQRAARGAIPLLLLLHDTAMIPIGLAEAWDQRVDGLWGASASR